MEHVIATEALGKTFGERPAVSGLDLSIAQGEVFGFLGPNGAGKTTTVRLLNGILTPSAGKAWVLGLDVETQGNQVREHTGVLTETPSQYEALTGRENLRFFGHMHNVPRSELEGRADALLGEFGLADRADERVGAYSKGMRQRLAIARALLPRPDILFLDEPTSGLDPAAARMVTDLIREQSHQGGRTIFLCTHNLAEAQRLCDRVAVIDKGALRAIGTPRELAQQLWPESWVDIHLLSPLPDDASERLAAVPSVLELRTDGQHLLLRVAGEDSIPDVVLAVATAGGRIIGVRPQEHTLEEVYFRIQNLNHLGQEVPA